MSPAHGWAGFPDPVAAPPPRVVQWKSQENLAPMHPVVRYMIVCRGYSVDLVDSDLYTAHKISTSLPLECQGVCILLMVSSVRREANGLIHCVNADTGEGAFLMNFSVPRQDSPLLVVARPLRVDSFKFPRPGMYTARLYFGTDLVEERPILVE